MKKIEPIKNIIKGIIDNMPPRRYHLKCRMTDQRDMGRFLQWLESENNNRGDGDDAVTIETLRVQPSARFPGFEWEFYANEPLSSLQRLLRATPGDLAVVCRTLKPVMAYTGHEEDIDENA